jgi:hypothetical protein
MNNTNAKSTNSLASRVALTSAIATTAVALLTSAPRAAAAGNPNPGVIPPNATFNDKTYGEWGAAWWQWALSIPTDRSPFTDRTGRFCAENQSGPVWFRGGAAASRETTCTIPAGKAIFMPVFNWIFGAGVYDCEPSVPGATCDVPTLQAAAAAATETATVLEVSLDGTPLQNIRDYRAGSPGPFPVLYPSNNILGLPAGAYFPQVTDGYWLMLAPLSKGTHTLQVHVVAPAVGISFTSVTHLIIVATGAEND